MSKHWTPRIVPGGPPRGWPGRRGRHRRPVKGAARRRLGWGPGLAELGLMVAGGMFVGIAFASLSAPSAGQAGEPGALASPAAVRVIDGDTFDYAGIRIRIADIDTPEVRGRCAFETGLAARATGRMRALLAAGPFELHPINGRDEDRYGRKLRIVTRGGRSLGDQLVAEGLARTWSGRREPWC